MSAMSRGGDSVHYLPFLTQVHDLLKPRTYLEIGVRRGHTLALATGQGIGVDPAPQVADDVTLAPGVRLVPLSSDGFFAAGDPLGALDPPVVDLALLDGRHHHESLLRDFVNVERHTGPGSVVVIDDVLPRTAEQAGREPGPKHWTGDVWRIVPSLRRARPDLILILVRTTPTGLLLVLGADRTDATLAAAYDDLTAQAASPAAEPTAEILSRSSAVYPAWVIGAPFWEVLRRQRELGTAPEQGRAELLAALQEWASSTLNDRQARAIHPSLTGRVHPPRTGAGRTATATRLLGPRPGRSAGRRGRARHGARQVIHVVQRRLRRLVEGSRQR